MTLFSGLRAKGHRQVTKAEPSGRGEIVSAIGDHCMTSQLAMNHIRLEASWLNRPATGAPKSYTI